MKVEASKDQDLEKLATYKRLRNEIKRDLCKDENNYFKTKFHSSETTVSGCWRYANDLLGTSKKSHSDSPKMICHNNRVYTTPKDVANILNNIFIEKVKKLRDQTTTASNNSAADRLKAWLETRETEIPTWQLQTIDALKLRKIISKVKWHTSCGIDFIDE